MSEEIDAAFIESTRNKVEKGFAVYGSVIEGGTLSYKAKPLYSHEQSFFNVLQEFKDTKYLPAYRKIKDELRIVVIRKREKRGDFSMKIHLLLFAATLITMSLAGYWVWAKGNAALSVIFAVALIGILGFHEFGHAFTAKKSGVDATPPFFIPVPPPVFPFGTLGAVIFMNSPVTDRKALIDIGAAGPIAGFLLSMPILLLGLKFSKVPTEIPALKEGDFLLGPSILFIILAKLFFRNFSAIDLHPLAIAGWIGLFITSLNLLPMGQLDGGHIVRGLFPRHYRKIYYLTALLLSAIGLIWPGWWLWVLLAWLMTRMEHPGPLNDVSELDLKRKLIGAFALVILLFSFLPVPIIPAELIFK